MIDDITEDATEPIPTPAQIIDHLSAQVHDQRELINALLSERARIRGVLSANGHNAAGPDLATVVRDAIVKGDGK